MHSPHIEERTVTSLVAVALDIAQRLDTQPGKAVVVCEHPPTAASITKRQWAQLLHAVERAYAATLNPHKRLELSQKIAFYYRNPSEMLPYFRVYLQFDAI